MSLLAQKAILSYLGASAALALLSILLAFIMGTVVPFRIGPDLAKPIPPGTVYTEAEMRKAEEDATLRMERAGQAFRDNPLSFVPYAKQSALLITWLPWFVAPFLLRPRSRLWLLALLVVPAILVITPFVITAEIGTYALALLFGVPASA